MGLSAWERTWCGVLIAGFAALAAAPGAAAASGLLIEVDRESFTLSTIDLRDSARGPSFPVVLGSPNHPTPMGDYPIYQVVHNPKWEPGPTARAKGAKQALPSPTGPMGVAKLPFATGGIALHGGAHPLLLGKPISLGCIRVRDEDLEGLLAWLSDRGALRKLPSPTSRALPDREFHRSLLVALRIRIR